MEKSDFIATTSSNFITNIIDEDLESGKHKHEDLDPIDRNTHITRRLCVAARGVDPVAKACFGEQPMAEYNQRQGPDNQHGNAIDNWLTGTSS